MCGAVPAGVKTAVLSLWMSSDNKYGFLELCSADVATVAMGLNGINYGGCGKFELERSTQLLMYFRSAEN